jgi:hypothetical protein
MAMLFMMLQWVRYSLPLLFSYGKHAVFDRKTHCFP